MPVLMPPTSKMSRAQASPRELRNDRVPMNVMVCGSVFQCGGMMVPSGRCSANWSEAIMSRDHFWLRGVPLSGVGKLPRRTLCMSVFSRRPRIFAMLA